MDISLSITNKLDTTSVQEQHIKHYLATGDYDFSPSDWPGGWADGTKSNYMMQQALIAEVKRRTQGLHVPSGLRKCFPVRAASLPLSQIIP